ncbi:hypothetical protein MANES_18G115432v8 [Manihot esculenta]|uniref:Uncharacterized protein n=1 Tax=Manihot esculenta TaxID=3983 RepID=A0ACB7G026_MANES|nr:hypothetical protein MANES_18G115432v8 [Manihot esculenta]
MEKDIKNYNLSNIEEDQTHQSIKNSREITDEMAIEILEEDINVVHKLNIEQLHAYKIILQTVDLNTSGVFFVDGYGGTEKIFLYRALLAYVRSIGMIALVIATSRIIAFIMLGGRTTHSRFSIPLSPIESNMCSISKQSGQTELLCIAKLIIWNEALMAKGLAIEIVDRSLRDIMDNSQPFGEKVIVFSGDFR